MYSLNRYEAQE